MGDYATVTTLMKNTLAAKCCQSCPRNGVAPYESSESPYTPVATAQLQGDYVARVCLVNLSQGIPLSILYDWKNDDNVTHDPANYEEKFGMTTAARAKAGL